MRTLILKPTTIPRLPFLPVLVALILGALVPRAVRAQGGSGSSHTPRGDAASDTYPLPDPATVYDEYYGYHGERGRAIDDIAKLSHWRDPRWREAIKNRADEVEAAQAAGERARRTPRTGPDPRDRPLGSLSRRAREQAVRNQGSLGPTAVVTRRRPVRGSRPVREADRSPTEDLQQGASEIWQGTRRVGGALGEGLERGWEAGKRGARKVGRGVSSGARSVGGALREGGARLLRGGAQILDDDDDDDD